MNFFPVGEAPASEPESKAAIAKTQIECIRYLVANELFIPVLLECLVYSPGLQWHSVDQGSDVETD